MASRQNLRIQIAGILYAYDMGNDEISEHIDELLERYKIRGENKEYAYKLYNGVMDKLEALDEIIFKYIEIRLHKKVGILEKAILRLLSYEILYESTEKVICINEGVEITKKLCGEKSAKFVNAILQSVSDAERVAK
jgi:N utilization substance protein B